MSSTVNKHRARQVSAIKLFYIRYESKIAVFCVVMYVIIAITVKG